MKTLTTHKSILAQDLSFTEDKMIVHYENVNELIVPLERFPRLRDADSNQLQNWRFIGDGEGIHWPALDEDILVENLLDCKKL
ncbi:MAG: DUF2442 domain-containing protein [Flavobacteriaceae bacterium]|nr:DUF2442 domain-containing protein [Flavobacteriaceae bacterium]MCY4268402.1 DUF2442 domain-containing protein [Flavobacteriaceae bacterium]MCY4299939.1 DUF2442 domain-containing protein [Flavobacteriaceae bacterium]